MALENLSFLITANGAKAITEMKKVSDQVGSQVRSTEGRFAKFGRIVSGAGLVAAAGIGVLASKMQESIDLAIEQRRVEAQLESVLTSTGHAAGVTAVEMKDLASELQGVTNFGDEATLSGINLLLTFTNIGRETLPRTVAAMQDLSTAMGQSLETSAVQLGKALNDPTKGMTALSRVGVSFTEESKATVAALEATGDMAGAQAVILGELERQFQGSARAAVAADGGITQVQNTIGDLQEEIGAELIPVQLKMAEGQLLLAERAVEMTDALTGMVDIMHEVVTLGGLISDQDLSRGWTTSRDIAEVREEVSQPIDWGRFWGDPMAIPNVLLHGIGHYRSEVDSAAEAAEKAERASNAWSARLTAEAAAYEETTAAVSEFNPVIADSEGVILDTEDALELLADAQEEAADLAKEHADELQDLSKALLDGADAAEAFRDSQDDLVDAQEDVVDAAKEYDDAVKEHGRNSEEAADALDDLTDAQEALADQIKETAEDQLRADGVMIDSQGGIEALTASMYEMARGAAPAVQEEVAQMIADLLQIPKETVLEFLASSNTQQAERDFNNLARSRTVALYAQLRGGQAVERYLANLRNSAAVTLAGIRAGAADIAPVAHGGIRGAANGGGGGGLTWTGENGPELIELPPGTVVHSNPDSERMVQESRMGGGPAEVRLIVDTAGSPMDDLLAQLIRRYVRTNHGGDVQAALGFSR